MSSRLDAPLFLDTPIFAERMFGDHARRQHLDWLIKVRRAQTSSYVRHQYQSTFLRAAVLLYNRLSERRDEKIVLRETDQFEFFTRGEGVKARKILARLMEAEGEIDDKLATLERWIERDIMRRFDREVEVVDGTGCCLCHSPPAKDERGVYRFQSSCTLKDPRPCQIDAFWADRASMLHQIGEENRVPAAIREAATQVISGAPPRGKRCWVALSDAVIVCEAPPGSEVSTTNIKDFQPLTEAVGGARIAKDPFQP